jgi:hypothetical protein
VTASDARESDERWLYRAGGIAAVLLGVGYLAIFALYAQAGAPPIGAGGRTWLEYFRGRTTVWWAIVGFSVLTDLLFIPVALSLYAALKFFNRTAMQVAIALIGLFVVLDLAVTWTHFASLITLSDHYAAAADDIERAADIAAATAASSVLGSHLFVVYAIVLLSVAILTIGIVMLNAGFGRIAPYLGIATGILGVASLSGSGVTIILNAVFATGWLFFVGVRLLRRAGQRDRSQTLS